MTGNAARQMRASRLLPLPLWQQLLPAGPGQALDFIEEAMVGGRRLELPTSTMSTIRK